VTPVKIGAKETISKSFREDLKKNINRNHDVKELQKIPIMSRNRL
jgi:hypothetical protein